MSLQFQCPNCGEILEVSEEDTGQPVACGGCSKHTLAPETLLSNGAILGNDFRIEDKLGEGGVALVYKAWQISLDRPAAIKILRENYSSNDEFIEQFIREARTAAKINHPNIVQAYAVGDEGGYYYFAMEHVKGQMLKDLIAQSERITVERSLSIVKDVARGLDEAWQKQELVHRDIKPDNIMIMNDRTVKVADLGLARPKRDILQELETQDDKEVLGTPQYISPEQLLGKAADNRTDIYSLGATLYHMLTGVYPFTGNTTPELARKHILENLTPPKEAVPERVRDTIPQDVSDLVTIMMAKRPGHRFQSTQELLREIESIENGKKLSRKGCKTLQEPLDIDRVDEELARTDIPEPSGEHHEKKSARSTSSTHAQKEQSGSKTKGKGTKFKRKKRKDKEEETNEEAATPEAEADAPTMQVEAAGESEEEEGEGEETEETLQTHKQKKKASGKNTKKLLITMLVIFGILLVGGGGAVITIATARKDVTKKQYPNLSEIEAKTFKKLEALSQRYSPEGDAKAFLDQAQTALSDFSDNKHFVQRVRNLATPYFETQLRKKRKEQREQELSQWRNRANKLMEKHRRQNTEEALARFSQKQERAQEQKKADLKRNVRQLIEKLKSKQKELRKKTIPLSRNCQFNKARTSLYDMSTASIKPERFGKWAQEEWAREQRKTLDQIAEWANNKRETLQKANKAFTMVKNAGDALEKVKVAIPGNPIPGKIQSITVNGVTVKTEVQTDDGGYQDTIKNVAFSNLKPDDMAKMIDIAANAKGINNPSERRLYVVCYLLNQGRKMNKLENQIRSLEGKYTELAGFMSHEFDKIQKIVSD